MNTRRKLTLLVLLATLLTLVAALATVCGEEAAGAPTGSLAFPAAGYTVGPQTTAALSMVVDLPVSLANQCEEVDSFPYWDGYHGAHEDPGDFALWLDRVTGYELGR